MRSSAGGEKLLLSVKLKHGDRDKRLNMHIYVVRVRAKTSSNSSIHPLFYCKVVIFNELEQEMPTNYRHRHYRFLQDVKEWYKEMVKSASQKGFLWWNAPKDLFGIANATIFSWETVLNSLYNLAAEENVEVDRKDF